MRSPDGEVADVDVVVVVAIGQQAWARLAAGVSPHGVVGRVDETVQVVVARRADVPANINERGRVKRGQFLANRRRNARRHCGGLCNRAAIHGAAQSLLPVIVIRGQWHRPAMFRHSRGANKRRAAHPVVPIRRRAET